MHYITGIDTNFFTNIGVYKYDVPSSECHRSFDPFVHFFQVLHNQHGIRVLGVENLVCTQSTLLQVKRCFSVISRNKITTFLDIISYERDKWKTTKNLDIQSLMRWLFDHRKTTILPWIFSYFSHRLPKYFRSSPKILQRTCSSLNTTKNFLKTDLIQIIRWWEESSSFASFIIAGFGGGCVVFLVSSDYLLLY